VARKNHRSVGLLLCCAIGCQGDQLRDGERVLIDRWSIRGLTSWL
jgi:hypothetical protein